MKRLKAAGLGPGNGEVVWLKLDLSDLKGTQAAAREVLEKEQRLDILGARVFVHVEAVPILISRKPKSIMLRCTYSHYAEENIS